MRKALIAGMAAGFALSAAPAPSLVAAEPQYDLVIARGRVMDPETNFDATAWVGVSGGRIEAVSTTALTGRNVIDARGMVVAPGFVDLHAHGQTAVAKDLQAQDGVTTAIDLEVGAYPVLPFYQMWEGRSRINYGVSVSHEGIRVKIKTGIDTGHPPTGEGGDELLRRKESWAETRLTDAELNSALGLFESEVANGGLGLGFGLEYTPAAGRDEVYSFFKRAAALGVPVASHVRAAENPGPGSLFATMQEMIANAAATGAPLHICHVTSKGLNDTALILDAIRGAREQGLDVTTEAYPYTAGATSIGSALFNEGWRERWASDYSDIEWPATGERLTKETFDRYREEQPAAGIIFHMIPEAAQDLAIADPMVMIASDGGGFEGGLGHPRGAGTFSRVLGRYVRQKQALSLMDALKKMTLYPAQRLEEMAPAMKKKGRLQIGADADIVVFDPKTIIDRATYREPMNASKGVRHVLVGGAPVVQNGRLVDGAYPGKGIKREAER